MLRIYSYSYGRKFSFCFPYSFLFLFFICAFDFYVTHKCCQCCQTSCCCPFCKLIECRRCPIDNSDSKCDSDSMSCNWGQSCHPVDFCVYSVFSLFLAVLFHCCCCHISCCCCCCCCIFISLSQSQLASQLASQQSQFNAHAAINADCEWEWDCYGINSTVPREGGGAGSSDMMGTGTGIW